MTFCFLVGNCCVRAHNIRLLACDSVVNRCSTTAEMRQVVAIMCGRTSLRCDSERMLSRHFGGRGALPRRAQSAAARGRARRVRSGGAVVLRRAPWGAPTCAAHLRTAPSPLCSECVLRVRCGDFGRVRRYSASRVRSVDSFRLECAYAATNENRFGMVGF